MPMIHQKVFFIFAIVQTLYFIAKIFLEFKMNCLIDKKSLTKEQQFYYDQTFKMSPLCHWISIYCILWIISNEI
jgi:hypothetical protein